MATKDFWEVELPGIGIINLKSQTDLRQQPTPINWSEPEPAPMAPWEAPGRVVKGLRGGVENAMALGSSLAGLAPAGFVAIDQASRPDEYALHGVNTAGEAVDKVIDKVAYKPKSDSAIAQLEVVGGVVTFMGEKLLPLREGYENTMNPLIGEKAAGAIYAGAGAAAMLPPGAVLRAPANAMRSLGGKSAEYSMRNSLKGTAAVADDIPRLTGPANSLRDVPTQQYKPMTGQVQPLSQAFPDQRGGPAFHGTPHSRLDKIPKGGKQRGSLGDQTPTKGVKKTAARSALDTDPASIGFRQRNLKGERVWVGAPPGIKTSEDIVVLAEEYAGRVERALDDGLDPDYFYLKGQNAIEGVSNNALQARQLAGANAITSSEAPVQNNFGWAVQPFEQRAAGVPVKTGKYPVEASNTLNKMFSGQDPHLGEKRHLYGQGLSGEGRKLPEELRRAPNDRFEIRSMGYPKDSVGPTQHEFMHGVRKIAMDIVNERRDLKLDVYNTQELNWAVARADDMGISIQQSAKDNIQNSIDHYKFQHSWETTPGVSINQLHGVDLKAHNNALRDIYIDPKTGKDRWVAQFGEPLQQNALTDVPGVFKGQVVPYGQQSNSLIYHKYGKMIEPSKDRVGATETTRSYLNLQDAGAGSDVLPSKRKTVPQYGGSLSYKMGKTITMAQAKKATAYLSKHYDVDHFGIVPTSNGVEIIATGAKGLEKHADELNKILGSTPDVGAFPGTGFYDELPWKERKATEKMLDSMTPVMRGHADSDSARAMVGQLYKYYEGLSQKPPKGYMEVLEAWATKGLAAVEKLVKKGLAPAAVLAILSEQQQSQGET